MLVIITILGGGWIAVHGSILCPLDSRTRLHEWSVLLVVPVVGVWLLVAIALVIVGAILLVLIVLVIVGAILLVVIALGIAGVAML